MISGWLISFIGWRVSNGFCRMCGLLVIWCIVVVSGLVVWLC